MESTTKQPRLTLVGAGPGDPELITLKGIRALATADVVLYDALISDELLRFAPASAKKVFVGKRAGEHAYTQDQINHRSEEHTSELQSLMRISYAVFCLKKKK